VLTIPDSGVLGNDEDAEGTPLTAVLVAAPLHGILTLNSQGGFVYKPAPNFSGNDLFRYRASDGQALSGLTTVRIHIGAINEAPIARDDHYPGFENAPFSAPPPGILKNDTDGDGDSLSVILVTPPSIGTLDLETSGGFTYTPPPGFTGGPVTFEYRVTDGEATSNVATVSINVRHNSPPVAQDDFYAFNGNPVVVDPPGVLGNDSDADGDPITALLVSGPSNGTLSFGGNGGFVYVPNNNNTDNTKSLFGTQDQFTYRVTDGHSLSGIATVTIGSIVCDCSF
jgi:hypothetical protein